MLHVVVLTFEPVNKFLKSATIQTKATKQYFPVVLFVMLFKMILTFASVDQFLKCNYSNESNFNCRSLSSTFLWYW